MGPSLTDVSLERLNELLQGGELRTLLEEGCQDNGSILLSVFPAHYRVMTREADRGAGTCGFFPCNHANHIGNRRRGGLLAVPGRLYSTAWICASGEQCPSETGMVNSQENPLSITVSYGI